MRSSTATGAIDATEDACWSWTAARLRSGRGPSSCRSSITSHTRRSAYHCRGFKEKTAILGIDGKGEYATTFFGYGENGKIHKIKEFYDPDSSRRPVRRDHRIPRLRDARRRVQGDGHGAVRRCQQVRFLAPVPAPFARRTGSEHATTSTSSACGAIKRRARLLLQPKLIEWLGPTRDGDDRSTSLTSTTPPRCKRLFEDTCAADDRLLPRRHPRARPASWPSPAACALNVKLNQRIIARARRSRSCSCSRLQATPAPRRRGGLCVATAVGEPVAKMEHVYLGPSYSNEECIAALRAITRHAGHGRGSTTCPRATAQTHGRWQPGGLVPGPHGVRSARARCAQHHRLPERCRAWPIASMRRSSSASAGGRSARACSTRVAPQIDPDRIIRRRS